MRDGGEAEGGVMAKTRIELTVWCVAREGWHKDAALRRVSDLGVERVDEGGDARNV